MLGFLVLFLVGLVLGGALSFRVPGGLFAVDRARAALERDSATSLMTAAGAADPANVELASMGALARALLLTHHGGGAQDRREATVLLKRGASGARTTPEGLYARAVLAATGDASSADDALDADLAASKGSSVYVALARAQRLASARRLTEARELLEPAALARDAPPHALWVLARLTLVGGDTRGTRALLERLWQREPDHALGRALAVVVDVLEDARDGDDVGAPQQKPRKRPDRSPRRHREGKPPGQPPRDDESGGGPPRTAAEEEALHLVERLDARDAGSLAWLLSLVATARGDTSLVQQLRPRLSAGCVEAPGLAAAALDLAVLAGDVGAGDEVLALLPDAIDDARLLAARARLRALRLVPEADRDQRAGSVRGIDATGLKLPFGVAQLNAGAVGMPVVLQFSAEIPESAIAMALAAGEGADGAAGLARRLEAVEASHTAEVALARNDLAGALEAVARARAVAPGDVEVLLLEARVRARQADMPGARAALDSATGLAGDDARAWVAIARSAFDLGDMGTAKRAVARVKTTGMVSAPALALEAVFQSRSGDHRGGRDLVRRATALAPDDVDVLRATLVIARDEDDLDDARAAADRLVALDDTRAADAVLRTWVAEGLLRQGNAARAQPMVDEVLRAQPGLADVWLVHGLLLETTDLDAALAAWRKAAALSPQSAVSAEATRNVERRKAR